MNKNTLRIVFVGDAKVGKTSMIKNSIEEDNGEDRQQNEESLLQPIRIQNENFRHNKTLLLVDTSSRRDHLETTCREISCADSIMLVYDLSNPESIPPLSTNWLPLIEEHNPKVPIILIGNKLDLVLADEEVYFKTKIKRIMPLLSKDFKQIELAIEVSVKENTSVREALYSAQNVVLYPINQLMNKSTKEFTVNFKKAILRIFRLLDNDKDGWLSDRNIRELQKSVFNVDMPDVGLKDIKDIIKDELGTNSVAYGINLQGFQFIFKRMLDMIKIKNCWVK